MNEECLKQTANKLINIAMPLKFDEQKFIGQLRQLCDDVYQGDEHIKKVVMKIVDTYKPAQN